MDTASRTAWSRWDSGPVGLGAVSLAAGFLSGPLPSGVGRLWGQAAAPRPQSTRLCPAASPTPLPSSSCLPSARGACGQSPTLGQASWAASPQPLPTQEEVGLRTVSGGAQENTGATGWSPRSQQAAGPGREGGVHILWVLLGENSSPWLSRVTGWSQVPALGMVFCGPARQQRWRWAPFLLGLAVPPGQTGRAGQPGLSPSALPFPLVTGH